MYGILHLSNAVPAKENLVVEVWNAQTEPRRIVVNRTRISLENAFETCGVTDRPAVIHPTSSFKVRLYVRFDQIASPTSFEQRKITELIRTDGGIQVWHDAMDGTWKRVGTSGAKTGLVEDLAQLSLVFSMNLVLDEFRDPVLCMRLYEPTPLRTSKEYMKLNHCADVAVTKAMVNLKCSVPLFIGMDEYVTEFRNREVCLERARLSVGPTSFSSTPLLGGSSYIKGETFHPAMKDLRTIYTNWIRQEITVLASLGLNKRWSRDVMQIGGDKWMGMVMTPLNYRVSGMPLFSIADTTPEDKNGISLRDHSGVSAQAVWYHDPDAPAVTEQWLLRRLEEVLCLRGQTLDVWRKTVDGMIQRQRAISSPRSSITSWSKEEHECISNYISLVRMHCTTRQYNYDHQWIWEAGGGKWVVTDTLTKLTCIEDCDGSAATTYSIAMTVLFPRGGDWASKDAKRLRLLAALVGVPCGVSGTGASLDFTHEECGGHMFCAFIPFGSFCRASLHPDDVAGAKKLFKDAFQIAPADFHVKAAICENIYFTTPFYSDHHGVSKEKEDAAKRADDWVTSVEGLDASDWEHYTTTHVMGKYASAQSHAFRVFTDMLAQLYPKEETSGFPCRVRCVSQTRVNEAKANEAQEEAFTPRGVACARSFVAYQPVRYTSQKEMEQLYPLYVEGLKIPASVTLETWEAWARTENVREDIVRRVAYNQRRIRERAMHSFGYGIPIELLAHGRPQFQLHATGTPKFSIIEMEKSILKAYDHPVVPLEAMAMDCFAQDPNWIQNVLGELSKSLRSKSEMVLLQKVPADSNCRTTIFVYDVPNARELETRIQSMYRAVRAKGVCLVRYGWCLACVFGI